MFEIQQYGGAFLIQNEKRYNLHSNGSIYKTAEYFPTREDAQAVLDKFQPKHVWKHGDVFKFTTQRDSGVMIYLKNRDDLATVLVYVDDRKAYKLQEYYLKNAIFLFNIKEKL